MPRDDVTGLPTRIDRVLVCRAASQGGSGGGSLLRPLAMRRLGTAGIGLRLGERSRQNAIHADGEERPSDHYGLLCELGWGKMVEQ